MTLINRPFSDIAKAKFVNPEATVEGKTRASVPLQALRTLWFNTGTLCNLTCAHCYIESSPSNDRLAYLEPRDVTNYLDDIANLGLPTDEIGFTGGEPFMNPSIIALLSASLERGYRTLVLTNAMPVMTRHRIALGALRDRYPTQLVLRVSIDHHRHDLHEEERGHHSWAPTMRGLKWLSDEGFACSVAGRLRWGDTEASMREGFAALFAAEGIALDAADPNKLVLFPEMDETADVPEITTECWSILNKNPADLMCASSRMVVRHKGAAAPTIVACTLLPYDARFDFGPRLNDALRHVKLNHPHCAKFCVLGGGRCSG